MELTGMTSQTRRQYLRHGISEQRVELLMRRVAHATPARRVEVTPHLQCNTERTLYVTPVRRVKLQYTN